MAAAAAPPGSGPEPQAGQAAPAQGEAPAEGADPGEAMEMLELFPRYLLKGRLPEAMLQDLRQLAAEVLANPASCPDAAPKLAGQLALQRQLGPERPAAAALCQQVILPACERWIRHVIDRQPPLGRGPWSAGRYGLQLIDLWLNVQRAGDYNPMHTHGGSFSGVVYLQVPPQIRRDSFDGQLCLHGPEDWHIQSFRTGMAHYLLPSAGDYVVFPAWQPHSVAPFRGEGERWSIAFNVVAVPRAAGPSGPLPAVRAPAVALPTVASRPPEEMAAPPFNVSLSRGRPRPGGFR